MRRRACLHPGCPATVDRDAGRRYCPRHDAQAKQRHDQQRNAHDPHRRLARQLYSSAAWQKLRTAHLALNPLCEECGPENPSPAVDLDHVEPLRKAWHRRLDPTNVRGLCKRHHARKTAAGR